MIRSARLFAIAACAGGAAAAPEVPTPVLPVDAPTVDGSAFQLPGPFPSTVTGATMAVGHQVMPLELSALATGMLPQFDFMAVEVLATGPFPMTTAFCNAGDNDLNISPFDPSDPLAFPGAAMDAFRSPPGVGNLSIDDGIAANYSWTPNAGAGVIMPNIAANFQDNGYTFLGLGTGPIKGHIHSSISRTGGGGYNMLTGFYEPDGSPGKIFVTFNTFSLPLSFETALAQTTPWFPYCEGWLAGWVAPNDPGANLVRLNLDTDNDGAGDTEVAAANGQLGDDVASWNDFASSDARIEIPGVSPETGMLFVSSSDNGLLDGSTGVADSGKILGVLPEGDGWDVAIRLVDGVDASGVGDRPLSFPPNDPEGEIRNGFSFLYVPYDACRLIGGLVDAENSAVSQGPGGIIVDRIGPGFYAVVIPDGMGGVKTAEDGGLMLQIADSVGGEFANPALPDRTYIDSEFDPTSGAFIVNVFEMVQDQTSPLGFTYNFRDSDFYLAWIDYSEPLQPFPCASFGGCNPADVNEDGMLNFADVSAFISAFNEGDTATVAIDGDASADTTGDGTISFADVTAFIGAFNSGEGCP